MVDYLQKIKNNLTNDLYRHLYFRTHTRISHHSLFRILAGFALITNKEKTHKKRTKR